MVNQAIIDKIERGDYLNDDELKGAFKHFKLLSNLLYRMGKQWVIQARVANSIMLRLYDQTQARGLKVKL